MKTFILVVIMRVYDGQAIQFQEFNSLSQCNYTRELIYKKAKHQYAVAFCVVK